MGNASLATSIYPHPAMAIRPIAFNWCYALAMTGDCTRCKRKDVELIHGLCNECADKEVDDLEGDFVAG